MSDYDDDDSEIIRAPDISQWSNRCPLCFEKLQGNTAVLLPCGCANSILCGECAHRWFASNPSCSFCRSPIPSADAIRPLPMLFRNMINDGGFFCKSCRTFLPKDEEKTTHRCIKKKDDDDKANNDEKRKQEEEEDAQKKTNEKSQDDDPLGAVTNQQRPAVATSKDFLGQRVDERSRSGGRSAGEMVVEPSRTEVAIQKAKDVTALVGEKLGSAASVVGSAASSAWSHVVGGGASPAAAGAAGASGAAASSAGAGSQG